MVNRDYILRLAEKLGRTLAIVLRLREYNQQEEALLRVDEELFRATGLTSSFLNSLSEETLIQVLSPLGRPNVDAALWAAVLLKAEGEIYQDIGNTTESYYRAVKALHLLLYVHQYEPIEEVEILREDIQMLIHTLDEYTLPVSTRQLLFRYQEHLGFYAQAEDTLFELLEEAPGDQALLQQGRDFYQRLNNKSAPDLEAGNFSHEEIQEGLEQLTHRFS